MISACITDPFAEWLRIKESKMDAFTFPRNGAQAAGCTEPLSKLLRTHEVCQLRSPARRGLKVSRRRRAATHPLATSASQRGSASGVSPRPSPIQCSRAPNTVRLIHQQSTTPRLYIPRVEYARLETGTLKDVTDDYYYGCSCQSCLHTARLSLSKLRSHLGADFPLRKIRERLKCQICSSRKVTITFLGPHQKGGNLHHLFNQQTR